MKKSLKCLPLTVLFFTFSQAGAQIAKHAKGNSVIAQRHKDDSTADKNATLLYGYQKETLRIQSVATINGRELEQAPVFNLYNTLYGKMAGLSISQAAGGPGNDGGNPLLRGLSPLILVDGIPRSVTGFDPEQIESVTVLKDALACAMLGIRANGGAILITTRKGSKEAGHMSFTAEVGAQTPLKMPQGLNAFDYATLYNEAYANDPNNVGKPPIYSSTDLTAYKNGTDPIGHPNVDWKNTVLKDYSVYSRYNLNIGGSGSSYRYFLSLDYLNQGGIFQQSSINAYSTNADYKRYNVRGNVEVNIDKHLAVSLNVFGRIQDQNEPGPGSATVFSNLLNTPSNAYPVYNPNGSFGGNATYQSNLYGQLISSGYLQGYNRNAGFDLNIKRNLDDVAKGLWVKGLMSFYNTLVQTTNRSRTLQTFQMAVGTANDTTYKPYGTRADQVNTSSTSLWTQQFYTAISAGYNRSFGKHGLDVIVMANSDNNKVVNMVPETVQGLNGSVAYNYAEKYMLEVAASYSGDNRYPSGNQYGFFPAIGLGWNLGNEPFFKNAVPFINKLKLRADYGKGGNANPGYYVYNSYFGSSTGYYLGTSATAVAGADELALNNPNVTWEASKKMDIGIDISFFHDKVSFFIDYFNNKLYNLLQRRGRSTVLLGNTYPLENIGINRYTGVDMSIGYQPKIGSVQLTVLVNGSLLQGKVEYMDEVAQPYSYLKRTGARPGQTFGYMADGLFQNQADINSSAKIDGYVAQPGDIKYKDLNGDGIINQFDITALGTNSPKITYGANLGANYKGLEISVVFDGIQNSNLYLNNISQFGFQSFQNGFGQAFVDQLGRWTPATAATATAPRLTIGGNSNNQATSSYYMKSGDYLRLRSMEIAYTFSNKLLTGAKIQGLRLFANAFNLLTFSKMKTIDPEVTFGYPNTRNLRVGATVRFL